MDQTQFHHAAQRTLAHWFARFEPLFDSGALEDLELHDGILTITFPNGTQLLLNRHGASQQLWLASRHSGGLHFNYDAALDEWRLSGGLDLTASLTHELTLEGIAVPA